MKKSLVRLVTVFCLSLGLYGVLLGVSPAQAATRTTANNNLSSAANLRSFLRNERPGFLSYYKSYNNTLLYHPNAGAGWGFITYGTTGLLTEENDGANDERDQCVDIDNSGFRFDMEIWANRGGGCGSNGTTTSYYVGGRVRFNPPNSVPVFLWVRDIDGLAGRQHITFSASALREVYIPNSNRTFDVSGGDDLISNGDGTCSAQTDARCNAAVLLLADAFYIKAGMRDGDARIRVDNGAMAQYRTLTFDPNGGVVADQNNTGAGQQTTNGSLDESTLYPHMVGGNLLREYELDATANEYPTPTRSGYTFQGWYNNNGALVCPAPININCSQSMNVDRQLIAHWAVAAVWNMSGRTTATPAVAFPGQQVTFTHYVRNDGAASTDRTISTDTQVSGGIGAAQPMRPEGLFAAGEEKQTDVDIVTIPNNAGVGDEYCQRVGFQWSAWDDSAYGSGEWACVVVGKYPHLEARNGDVFAGGVLPSSSPTCTIASEPIVQSSHVQLGAGGPHYTSFATYGVTSLGRSQWFGSTGLSHDGGVLADDLVFANTSSGPEGFFFNTAAQGDIFPANTHSLCLNDPFARFASSAETTNNAPTINVGSLTGNVRLTATGTVNLNGGVIQPGQRIIIYAPDADILIDGDITYADGPYASINDIPQLIVLTERRIIVTDTVTRIDGLFGARTDFLTCDLIPRLNVCNTPLTINGAVITGRHVIPMRTAGAEAPNYEDMAEIFNLHPAVNLNQLPAANTPDVFITTVNEIEVPPRF